MDWELTPEEINDLDEEYATDKKWHTSRTFGYGTFTFYTATAAQKKVIRYLNDRLYLFQQHHVYEIETDDWSKLVEWASNL